MKNYDPKTWIIPPQKFCKCCGKEISRYGQNDQCSGCAQRVVIRPSRDELKNLIFTQSFEAIGRLYKVSGTTIVNWCKFYNLPFHRKEIATYSVEKWQKI